MTDTDTNPNALIHAMRDELHRLLYNEGPGAGDRDNTCEDERNVRSWNTDDVETMLTQLGEHIEVESLARQMLGGLLDGWKAPKPELLPSPAARAAAEVERKGWKLRAYIATSGPHNGFNQGRAIVIVETPDTKHPNPDRVYATHVHYAHADGTGGLSYGRYDLTEAEAYSDADQRRRG